MTNTVDGPIDPLGPVPKRPACVTCNKSKRKCNRQLPACQLCRKKKIRCTYVVPSVLVPSLIHNLTATTDNSTIAAVPLTPSGSSTGLQETVYSVESATATGPGSEEPRAPSEAPWFLSPCSWEIDHVSISEDNQINYPDSGLDYFLGRMRIWLDQWTKENKCPFIHPRLYGADLPSQLQYAHAAWLTYRSATTTASKKIALSIATNWSKNLVQEQAMYDSLADGALDLVGHLSRTQALLIFQMIGLFDGDVRARAEAQDILDTLTRWTDALFQKAGADAISPYPIQPDEQLNHPGIKHLQSDHTLSADWKAWILSESIRRTWILATLTQSAFLIMKQNFAICPGSIAFSGREGLWDASSPHVWQECSQKSSTVKTTVFCRGLVRLLVEASPLDVDDFTQALLTYGSGREMVEDWLASASKTTASHH